MSSKATRRTFLKLSAAAASISAAELAHAAPVGGRIAIISDESPLVRSEPVQFALGKLRDALTAANLTDDHSGAALHIHIALPGSQIDAPFALPASLSQPETVALIPGNHMGKPAILVTGVDARGIVYGLLELTDRVHTSSDPITALRLPAPIIETTPNKVRSVARAFVSEQEDKPWFYDRAFWSTYLDTLASARFNRFNFTLGIGYDFPRGVTGDYLHFPYPYLVEVPGYEGVHVEPALQPGERQRNLETLQYIAAETARRGLDFQLAIWTHAYEWTDSPKSDHHIVGLTPETHAQYCHDGLALILKACPQIKGLTLRIHGESGIPEGSYPFWQKLFSALPEARTPDGKPRVIELDLHAKGLDPQTIALARATGMPVKAGCKFWAEHLGLGYHQADIRAFEYPRTGVTGTFAVSNGARNFTRYGYGDFYSKDYGMDLIYRVWPGTQRHLLWGDPALAAGYGRAANFCGASGMELCEPFFFKGREGSGHPNAPREAYADTSLAPANLDTAKFAVTYMTWGRYLYNPDTDPSFYHRYLKQAFGPAGPALETALAASSRILPLITTAWLPSASNHEFWAEMPTSVQILPYTDKRPLYGDSPVPHNVSAISPLDPQLFTSIDQHAKDLIAGTIGARYNTRDVIVLLQSLVATSNKGLDAARAAAAPSARTQEFRRAEEDIFILNGLGTYYANLFQAALYYSLYEQKPGAMFAQESVKALRAAREAWAAMATRAKTVYAADISYGGPAFRRGHWVDRIPAIDADIAALEKHFADNATRNLPADQIPPLAVVSAKMPVQAQHTPPAALHPGQELVLSVDVPRDATQATMWYRHVNHGERWLSIAMQKSESRFGLLYTAAIPANYTDSPYPLQYYFELQFSIAGARFFPTLGPQFNNQPYYAIYKRA